MRKIKDVFTAKASSLQETFLTEMGVASFTIPIYQRQYSWDKENILRLLEDIYEGLLLLGSTEDYLTFIGTILLVDDDQKTEPSFDGKSLSVVDGQQRLTTLALVITIIQNYLNFELNNFEIYKDNLLTKMLKEEAASLSDQLFACVVGSPSGPTSGYIYEYFPRLVRKENDIRANTADEAKYNSAISDFLFQFCRHVINNKKNKFEYTPSADSDSLKGFNERINIVETFINDEIYLDNNYERKFPSVQKLFEKSEYRKSLFPKLQQRNDRIHEVLNIVRNEDNHDLCKLIRIISFGNFLLHRVVVNQVIADDERYAFDIFEALNTTGEPLTALETFKPSVIKFENSLPEKYHDSPSEKAFNNIENYIRLFNKYEEQQRESRDIIVLHALYVCGKKEGLHLSSQRRYLRKEFQNAKNVNAKRRFVIALSDIADFRNRFWQKESLTNQLRNSDEKEVALFCIDFIRVLGNTLALPILIRYWKESEKSGDISVFIMAVKAVTAFLVIRRSATGGTYGIDSDYRKLMSEGATKQEIGKQPLCIGTDNEENELPDVKTLKKYLRSYLEKLSINEKDKWLYRVRQQPLYKSGPSSLCRFILLTAAHNSVPDNRYPYLLKKDRPHPGRDYMNLHYWRSKDFESVEHIAPQNTSAGWKKELYDEDINLIHYLGNLTLLPDKENSRIGDKPWEKKKVFFNAAAAETSEKVEEQIEEAKNKGMDFGRKTNNMLREMRCLPILSSVGKAEDWTVEIVKQRTINIAELLWQEVSDWLDI